MKNIELIKNDNLHGKAVLKGNHIGFLKLWAFNNCYLFLDIQSGKKFKIPLNKLNKLTILNSEEYIKRYDEINKPSNLFKNEIFIGDKNAYEKRIQNYGLIHDLVINHSISNNTNKMWTYSFCRTFAMIKAKYEFYLHCIKNYGTWYDIPKEKMKDLYKKFFVSSDGSDVYSKTIKEIGMDDFSKCILTEKQISEFLKKAKALDEDYHKVAYEHKVILLNSSNKVVSKEIKNCKEEIKYYLNV